MTEQQEDISSRTLLVLVLLTLAVSFIGAWVSYTTADALSTSHGAAATPPPAAGAKVSFEIVKPLEADTSASVGLEIKPRGQT